MSQVYNAHTQWSCRTTCAMQQQRCMIWNPVLLAVSAVMHVNVSPSDFISAPANGEVFSICNSFQHRGKILACTDLEFTCASTQLENGSNRKGFGLVGSNPHAVNIGLVCCISTKESELLQRAEPPYFLAVPAWVTSGPLTSYNSKQTLSTFHTIVGHDV